jgi:hypothetical protein
MRLTVWCRRCSRKTENGSLSLKIQIKKRRVLLLQNQRALLFLKENVYGKKIAFIGAGSFGFTRGLVRDILTFPAFADAEIALMDVNKERLGWIKQACEKIVRAGNYPASVTATTSRKEALNGADGVLCTILSGDVDVQETAGFD